MRIERYTFDWHYGFHSEWIISQQSVISGTFLFLDFSEIINVNSVAQAIMLGFCR